MHVQFEFTNVDTDRATWVFVGNRSSGQTEPDHSATCNFSFVPWQRLNPSCNAREDFAWFGAVAASAGSINECERYRSNITPLRVGGSYLMIPGKSAWQIVWCEEHAREGFELTAAPTAVNEDAADIAWYLDGQMIGRQADIPPGGSRRFSIPHELCFLPVPAETGSYFYSSEQLTQATSFTIPSAVTNVRVTANRDWSVPTGVRYSFDPR